MLDVIGLDSYNPYNGSKMTKVSQVIKNGPTFQSYIEALIGEIDFIISS